MVVVGCSGCTHSHKSIRTRIISILSLSDTRCIQATIPLLADLLPGVGSGTGRQGPFRLQATSEIVLGSSKIVKLSLRFRWTGSSGRKASRSLWPMHGQLRYFQLIINIFLLFCHPPFLSFVFRCLILLARLMTPSALKASPKCFGRPAPSCFWLLEAT